MCLAFFLSSPTGPDALQPPAETDALPLEQKSSVEKNSFFWCGKSVHLEPPPVAPPVRRGPPERRPPLPGRGGGGGAVRAAGAKGEAVAACVGIATGFFSRAIST